MDTSITPQLPHQDIRAFKIWYSDSIYEGKTYQDWCNAPSDDVQVVMVYFKQNDDLGRPTRLYSSGSDYYAMTENMKFSSGSDDPKKVKGHILHGKYMNYEELLKLEREAFDDYGKGWLYKSLPDPAKGRGRS